MGCRFCPTATCTYPLRVVFANWAVWKEELDWTPSEAESVRYHLRPKEFGSKGQSCAPGCQVVARCRAKGVLLAALAAKPEPRRCEADTLDVNGSAYKMTGGLPRRAMACLVGWDAA